MPSETTESEPALASTDSSAGLFEEEAPHLEDELPFYDEADV